MKLDVVTRFAQGVRTSVSDNAAVYGFSVLVTTSLAVIQVSAGKPTVGRVFLFAMGAAGAFAVFEALGSNFFRNRVKPEPPEVTMLGGAMAFFSISSGLATAWGVAAVARSWVGWGLGSFSATAVYLLVVGVEMALARRAEEAEGNAS